MKTVNLELGGKLEGSIKRYDTFNSFHVTLSPNPHVPCLDVEKDKVKFLLRGNKVNQQLPETVEVNGSIVRADTGVLSVDFTTEDYDKLASDTYLLEAQITFEDGRVGIYPTSNHFLLNIVEPLKKP